MDIIKKNIGLIIFLVFSLVVAGVIMFTSRQYYREVREKRDTFEDHRQYFEGLARRSPGISESNLRMARENLEVAQEQLERLHRVLARRSQLEVPSMSAVEAKNYLDSESRRLATQLSRNNIQIADNARGFSFQEVIQATGLPEEEREVPALIRQMRVVSRVVETSAESGIHEFVSLDRPAGIREIRRDGYNIIRLHLQVRGPLNSIKRLVNNLHEDSQYYFSIPYFQWETEGTDQRRDTVRRDRSPARTRSAPRPTQQRDFGFGQDWEGEWADIDHRSDRRARDQDDQQMTREMRRIAFRDSMTAFIPVHFIEFKPDKEN